MKPVPDGPAAGSLLTRVLGTAQPRARVLKEFESNVAELRRRYDPLLWPLFIPKVQDVYRWRIQLQCGCVREILTSGGDIFADERSDVDPLSRSRLPKGQYWCTDHEVQRAYREVVEWVDKEIKTFPPDSKEPKYDLDPETWEKVRRTEQRTSAIWRVRLACGHLCCNVITDENWEPEDGPSLVSPLRRDEMLRDFETLWVKKEGQNGWPEEGPERDHVRKMLNLRWPRPEPERDCFACTRAKSVTGYQRIGWLVPRNEQPARPALTGRQKVEAKLAKAEEEVRRLRRQLDDEVGGEK